MIRSASLPKRSARKAKGDGHTRRGEILAAAERIFVADGFEGATIRRIADEVGVSPTALYLHFPDKRAILLEICNRALQGLHERNSEIAARPLDAAERLRLIMEAYARWGEEQPNTYQLVYCTPVPLSAEAWPAETVELVAKCYESFAGVVIELEADGRLRRGDSNAVAQAIWMACHGVIALTITRPDFPWADRNQLITLALDGAMAGLIAA